MKISLRDARRILFLGDSITYDGKYIEYIEASLRLNYPDWSAEVMNLGLPSETVSGLSEPNHADGKFPRPHIHERLSRVLNLTQPDLVFACYGMNDGIGCEFDETRFEAFRTGIEILRVNVIARNAPLVLMTPPVFDPLTGAAGGLGFCATYDEVLERYTTWLLEQRIAGWNVVDVHGVMKHVLRLRREIDPTFAFAPDGIHPGASGHAVIAAAILEGGGSSRLREWPIRFANGAHEELVGKIRERSTLLKHAWLSASGHRRPGLPSGLPLDVAREKARTIWTSDVVK